LWLRSAREGRTLFLEGEDAVLPGERTLSLQEEKDAVPGRTQSKSDRGNAVLEAGGR